MMQRQETPLTFEQATITAESYVGDEEKLRCLVEKACGSPKLGAHLK